MRELPVPPRCGGQTQPYGKALSGCETPDQLKTSQERNRPHPQTLCSEGSPVLREPASPASGAMDGEARAARSERGPGGPERTSGDGARATPKPRSGRNSPYHQKLPNPSTNPPAPPYYPGAQKH
jgi:hypothetical protein